MGQSTAQQVITALAPLHGWRVKDQAADYLHVFKHNGANVKTHFTPRGQVKVAYVFEHGDEMGGRVIDGRDKYNRVLAELTATSFD